MTRNTMRASLFQKVGRSNTLSANIHAKKAQKIIDTIILTSLLLELSIYTQYIIIVNKMMLQH